MFDEEVGRIRVVNFNVFPRCEKFTVIRESHCSTARGFIFPSRNDTRYFLLTFHSISLVKTRVLRTEKGTRKLSTISNFWKTGEQIENKRNLVDVCPFLR